jgi:hypothetical protein
MYCGVMLTFKPIYHQRVTNSFFADENAPKLVYHTVDRGLTKVLSLNTNGVAWKVILPAPLKVFEQTEQNKKLKWLLKFLFGAWKGAKTHRKLSRTSKKFLGLYSRTPLREGVVLPAPIPNTAMRMRICVHSINFPYRLTKLDRKVRATRHAKLYAWWFFYPKALELFSSPKLTLWSG